MDFIRSLERFMIPSIRRGTTPRIRASMGLSGGLGGPSPGIVSSSRGLLPAPVGALGMALGGSLNMMSRAAVIPALIDETQKVFNPKDNIVTSLQNLGTSIQNLSAAPGRERRYIGSDPVAVRANRALDARADKNRPLGQRSILNGKPVFWTGPEYEWQTGPSALKAGLLGSEVVGDEVFATSQIATPAPTLPPPSSFTTATAASGGPGERALQREKVQAAAQVATNPLMQQWEAAKQAKDFEKADELGMQIWQSKYGKTPLGQPGGALGTTNPLMQSTFGYQANMSPRDISKVITNPSPASPQPSEASIQMGDLGTRAMGDTGYDPAAYGITPEQIEAIKQKLLAQAKK